MTVPPKWFVEALAAPHESRFVDVQGCRIHYLRWGDPRSPGLVLVHGGAAHAHWWSFLAPLLMRDHHVIAPDLSGHGESGRRDRYPRELWAEEVLAVSEDAGFIAPPAVVGHSLGGMVTIVAASRHGESLAGAIIVDTPVRKPDPESEEGQHGRMFRNPKRYPDLETALQHFYLSPPQPCENDYILDHIARHSLHRIDGSWTWKFDPRIFLRVSLKPIAEYLSQIRCRVAVLRGEFSDLVPPETGDYMYELLDRNAPIVEIPQAHHHLILDQPLAVVAALRALLADWEHSVPRRRRIRT